MLDLGELIDKYQIEVTDRTEQNLKDVNEIAQLKADRENAYKEIRDMNIPMPCGHLARYAVNVDEGTQYCLFCAADEMFDSLRNYKDYRNMLEHSPQMKDGYISINTLLLFDESDANAFDNYSKIKGEDNYE